MMIFAYRSCYLFMLCYLSSFAALLNCLYWLKLYPNLTGQRAGKIIKYCGNSGRLFTRSKVDKDVDEENGV